MQILLQKLVLILGFDRLNIGNQWNSHKEEGKMAISEN